jgi:hypothetical protein
MAAEREVVMFSMKRGLFLLMMSLAGVGMSRGWFHLCTACGEGSQENVNLCVSLDTQKVKSDFGKLAEKFEGLVAEPAKRREAARDAPAAGVLSGF